MEEEKREEINETGSIELTHNNRKHNIQLLTIIGEIEGHEAVSGNTKATKYEHLLPKLAEVEDNEEIEGLLILLNTLGGDVEAGLAIAEMIASLSKPTVSLVLGGSHSIGGPLAVSADYSFIVPSGTMIIHPVRSNGMFIGVIQSYRNMERTQDRIIRFLAGHSHMTQERIEELMLDSTQLVKDVGTLLEGEEAVKEGLIDAVGGMSDALTKLHEMIEEKMNKNYKFSIDTSKDFIEEQELMIETRTILAYIFLNYWATEIQKEKVNIKFKKDIEDAEKQKRDLYNVDILKNKKQLKENIGKEQENAMVIYKKENFITKIFNTIKKFFGMKH